MYYAGIGARITPQPVLDKMRKIAMYLEFSGYTLRSGGALGADLAFESSILDPRMKQIFRPQDATPASIELASRYHPNWKACSEFVRKLHARNALILLGKNLSSPVQFVICWTPEGAITGGTGLSIKIAMDYRIPVFNLANPEHEERVMRKIHQ